MPPSRPLAPKPMTDESVPMSLHHLDSALVHTRRSPAPGRGRRTHSGELQLAVNRVWCVVSRKRPDISHSAPAPIIYCRFTSKA